MTYGQAKTLVKQFLLGDNSNAEVTELVAQQALQEIATLCEPIHLLKEYTTSIPNDVFRIVDKYEDSKGIVHTRYIRTPQVLSDSEEIDLDIDLHTAFVFMCCAYLSFKQKDYYEQKASGVISIYKSNHSFEVDDTY